MADDDDDLIRRAYEAGGFRPKLIHAASDGERQSTREDDFPLRPIIIQDQDAIPHRRWLYGKQLIRAFVTLLIAPGGTGKSSLLLAMLMAIATGKPLLGTRVHQRCNVALLNLEDPQEEIDRRVTALALRYGLSNADLDGHFFVSEPEQAVSMARVSDDGFSIIHPDEKRLIKRIRELNIGVLAVDPFSESHTLEENSNPAMVKAMAAWRRVGRSTNCSVVLSHHVRKGVSEGIESSRGAKALTDSARIGLMLSAMSEEDANQLGVKPDERFQYVQLENAKANMASRSAKKTWFHLSNVTLANADETYAFGDDVGVIEAWKPQTVWQSIPVPLLNEVLDRIDAGLANDVRYTDSRRGNAERWAGYVLIEMCGLTDGQAGEMLKTWGKNGVLESRSYYDRDQRHNRLGLFVNATKRPGSERG